MPDIYAIIEAQRARLLAREETAETEINAAYSAVEGRILGEIHKLTQRIEAARAAGEVVNPAWLTQKRRLSDLWRQVEAEIRRFSVAAAAIIETAQSAAVTMAQFHLDQVLTASIGDQAAQIGVTFNHLPARTVEALVGAAGDGSPLRALFDALGPDVSQSIRDQLIQAVALGWNPNKTASAISDALGGNRARVRSIARTETMRAYREAAHQTAQQNADVLDGWTWLSALSGSCAACVAMHGTFHLLEERMASHVNCRCTQIFESKPLEALSISGADWFAAQPESVQVAVLGIAGAEAYRAGEVKLGDFVGLSKSKDWGAAYYQRSLRDAMAGRRKPA